MEFTTYSVFSKPNTFFTSFLRTKRSLYQEEEEEGRAIGGGGGGGGGDSTFQVR